jgi:hypothetical protein
MESRTSLALKSFSLANFESKSKYDLLATDTPHPTPGPRRQLLLRFLSNISTFPLSPDHLIPLVQFNVFRAMITNMTILSLTHRASRQCDVLFPAPPPLFPTPAGVPRALAPTALQTSTPHQMYIDLLPDPRMRDNALRRGELLDGDGLCADMVGGLYHGRNNVDTIGLLVWSEPWRVDGWEISEGFVRKWGFLIEGCWELMEATNRWRGQRGEEPLEFGALVS